MLEVKKQISTVSIIGSGNVATALSLALKNSFVDIIDVFSPNIENAKLLAIKIGCSYVDDIKYISKISDLYIIATPDKEISNVCLNLTDVDGIVVHTSGSVPASVFSSLLNNFGVFYPLQTFTKNAVVDFKNIPICIESNSEVNTEMLLNLANKLSNNVVSINTEQRQYLHLAAVTVNNFTNTLYTIAHELLAEKQLDFSLLIPLINETANKINNENPYNLQTGPARRNDIPTINKHLSLLDDYPDYRAIYNLMSNKIIKKYNE